MCLKNYTFQHPQCSSQQFFLWERLTTVKNPKGNTKLNIRHENFSLHQSRSFEKKLTWEAISTPISSSTWKHQLSINKWNVLQGIIPKLDNKYFNSQIIYILCKNIIVATGQFPITLHYSDLHWKFDSGRTPWSEKLYRAPGTYIFGSYFLMILLGLTWRSNRIFCNWRKFIVQR